MTFDWRGNLILPAIWAAVRRPRPPIPRTGRAGMDASHHPGDSQQTYARVTSAARASA